MDTSICNFVNRAHGDQIRMQNGQNREGHSENMGRACSLVVSHLRSETKGSRFESGW